MTFRVGQKVVCVDARVGRYHRTPLVKGAIYTISGFDTEHATCSVYLAEVSEKPMMDQYKLPVGWNPDRFRPIVSRKTDISIFTAMLNPSKVDA